MNLNQLLTSKQASLAAHFKPGFLQREYAVFQFHFEHGEPFFLELKDQTFRFAAGKANAPTINLFLDSYDTCWALLDGSLDGMQAFMDGRYRADGNIVLSQLLLYLFKSNEPTIVYEVQD